VKYRKFYIIAIALVLVLSLYWYVGSKDIPLNLTRHSFTASLLDAEGKLDIPLALRNRFLAESEGKDHAIKENGFRKILLAIGDQFYFSTVDKNDDRFVARFKAICEILHCLPESPPPYSFVQLYLPFYERSIEPTDLQKDFRTILSQRKFWTLDSFPFMESWIEDNSPFLDHLRTIVRGDFFSIPIIDTGFQENFPLQFYAGIEYRMITSLGSSLKCRALFFAGNGDWHEAMEDIIAGIHLEWLLLQTELSRVYFMGRPPDFFDLARQVIQTEEFLADDRSQELLAALLEALNACPPRMPGANFYFMSRLLALENILAFKSLTRESIFDSPGILLAPVEQVLAVLEGASESSLSRYKRMTFDWNVVLTEIFKGIEELEQLSKGLSIESMRDDTARALVAVQRSKFHQANQRERDFAKTARDHSLRLSFLAKRSELLGRLMFIQDFSSADTEVHLVNRHDTWLRLKREVESLSHRIP
jgi:hypothetical protein